MHCAGCQGAIVDRYLLNVLDCAWHVRCVQCVDCGCALSDKCFSRDGKLYCRADFFRRFGTKCAGCSQGISPNDLVRKARDKVFHLKCFTCMICRKQLSTGEELYIVGENKFLCKEDYLHNKVDGSDIEDDVMDFDSTMDSQDGMNDKDLFNDDKSQISIKNNSQVDVKPDNSVINSNSVINTNKSYPTKLNGTCPSPLKMEPNIMADQISLKLENGLSETLSPSPHSPDINMNCSATSGPGSDESVDINDNVSCGDLNDNDEAADTNGNHTGPGSKRRGPRTTIKAKQLEVLKVAFNSTPKPTRHIREQLASETGLTMRVIQVWFQNKRSKERRMKQLSALGARRQFYRTPRRMRALRGDIDDVDMMGPGYGYFNERTQPSPDDMDYDGDSMSDQVEHCSLLIKSEPDMYGNYPPYNTFYPGQGSEMGFMMPNRHGTPPHMEPGMVPNRGMMPDGQYMPGSDILPPSSSPDSMPLNPDEPYPGGRPMGAPFSSLQHLQGRAEMTSEVW